MISFVITFLGGVIVGAMWTALILSEICERHIDRYRTTKTSPRRSEGREVAGREWRA